MFRLLPSRAVYLASGLGLLVLAAAMLGACGESSADKPIPPEVTATNGARTSDIAKNKFESPMRVTVGSEVTWVNQDGVAHNIIASGGAFKSGTMGKGDTFAHTFDQPGRFTYLCSLHSGMDGVIEAQ